MTSIEDFDIIVSTTDTSESVKRRERLAQYFANAGITLYTFEVGQIFKDNSIPRNMWRGADLAFAKIVRNDTDKDIIYVEDDAILTSDFKETHEIQLAKLPNDWQVCVTGWVCMYSGQEYWDYNIPDHFGGSQCVFIKAGDWRKQLANDIESRKEYEYNPRNPGSSGFESALALWCKAQNVKLYLSVEPLVGQGGCKSLTTGGWQTIVGLSRGSYNVAMTIDDFDIIVSTTDSPLSAERRERLANFFAAAGITNYRFDTEPVCTVKPEGLTFLNHPGNYGCDRHFANILKRNTERDIIYIEDDALISLDFRNEINCHLAELPSDWDIFCAGYSRVWNPISVSENIKTVDTQWGTQCIMLRKGEWQSRLADAILSHDFYKYGKGGFDVGLSQWCKAHSVKYFLAAKSFVGQGNGLSITTGRQYGLAGIHPSKIIHYQSGNNMLTCLEKLFNYSNNEKIALKTSLADKFKGRLYVQRTLDDALAKLDAEHSGFLGTQTSGIDYIVPLIGKWNNVDYIDFNLLPFNCILKANHGSRFNAVFTKHTTDKQIQEIKEKLKHWLTVNYYTVRQEAQYKNIARCIIAEELIRNKKEYKVYCFNGVPKYILILDWFRGREHQTIYDADFNLLKGCSLEHLPVLLEDHPVRVINPEKLKFLAATLSEPFRFVRVDFLVTSDKIYFNELTFTPSGLDLHLTPLEFKAEVEGLVNNLFT